MLALAASRLARRVASAPIRSLSVWESISSSVTQGLQSMQANSQAAKAQELFKAQMDFLKEARIYTMETHITMLEEIKRLSGVNGWQRMFRTAEQQRELDRMLADVEIAGKLEGEERKNPSLIGRKEKLRIATAAGVDVSKVNLFLKNWEQHRDMHGWVRARVKADKPLPASPTEYLNMVSADRTGMRRESLARNLPRQRGKPVGSW